MNVLRAANETDTRHAEAVGVECFLRGSDERRMIGQAEIIVRAHVKHAFATGDFNVCVLRASDDALRLEKALRLNFIERLRNLLFKFGEHRIDRLHRFRTAEKEHKAAEWSRWENESETRRLKNKPAGP